MHCDEKVGKREKSFKHETIVEGSCAHNLNVNLILLLINYKVYTYLNQNNNIHILTISCKIYKLEIHIINITRRRGYSRVFNHYPADLGHHT